MLFQKYAELSGRKYGKLLTCRKSTSWWPLTSMTMIIILFLKRWALLNDDDVYDNSEVDAWMVMKKELKDFNDNSTTSMIGHKTLE